MKSSEFINEGIFDAAARYGFLGKTKQYQQIGQDIQKRKDIAMQQVANQAQQVFYRNLQQMMADKEQRKPNITTKDAAALSMKQILSKYQLDANDVTDIDAAATELETKGYKIGQPLSSANAGRLFAIARDVSSKDSDTKTQQTQEKNFDFPTGKITNWVPKSAKSGNTYNFDANTKTWYVTARAGATGLARPTPKQVTDPATIQLLNNEYAKEVSSSTL